MKSYRSDSTRITPVPLKGGTMRWNLKNRFLVPTLLAIVLGMGAASVLSFTQSKNAVNDALMNQSEQMADALVRQISAWIDDITNDIRQMAHRDEFKAVVASRGMDREAVAKADQALADIIKIYGFGSMGLLGKDGTALAYSSPGSSGTLNLSDRGYFKEAITGKIAVSDALKSRVTGKPVMAVAIPYLYEGKQEGVFIAVVNLDSFSETFIDPVKLGEGETGYAFLMARSGVLAAHPDKSTILKTNLMDSDWGAEMARNGNGVISYEWKGDKKIVTYRKEPKSGWIIGITAIESDIFSSIKQIRNSSILISAIVVFVVGCIVFIVVRGIAAALSKGVIFAEAVAEGDLSQQLELDRTDEIGVLAAALRKMVGNLKEMIQTAETKTTEAEEQSEKARIAMQEAEEARRMAESAKREGMLQAAGQLEGIVERLNNASDELTRTVNQATRGSDIQRERTSETATAIEEMNATVMEVARNAGDAADSAEEARSHAEEGYRVVEDVVRAIEEVDTKSDSMKQGLNSLGQHAEGIGQIMNVITDIADQTNLLALNAAIEAARAGDAGRGFAVVADEVRKLAEKTMEATGEVGQVVTAIQESSRTNIRGMEEASQSVEESTRLAAKAGESLRDILRIVEANADQVRSIATASEEQSAASEQISRSADEINSIASETAQAMNESSGNVTELSNMARELVQLIEHLKSEE